MITTATARDLGDVVALLSAQFAEHDIAVAQLVAAARGLLDVPSRGAIFLATVDDARVGIAVLPFTWTLEHGGPVAWLDELYVTPPMRGRGIGGALLEHALAHARASGFLAVDLEIDADHTRAARLYARAGFTQLARTRWALTL